MSHIPSIINRSAPFIKAHRSGEFIQVEASKGCDSDLFSYPTKLEPYYSHTSQWKQDLIDKPGFAQATLPKISSEIMRLRCFISQNHELEWFRAERFLKQLQGLHYRAGFEIIGNEDGIAINFIVHKDDFDVLKFAFDGEYADSEFKHEEDLSSAYDGNICFYDLFPVPPYHHLLTCSNEFKSSPYDSLIPSFSKLKKPTTGFVQVFFEPARNNWHQNVELLTNLEFAQKTLIEAQYPNRSPQQLPAAEIHGMAREVARKAHNDKPFYFATFRVGTVNPDVIINPRKLAGFSSLFQHGGRPLQHLTEKDYQAILEPDCIREMLISGTTYHPGFLANSQELSGLIHLPSCEGFIEHELPIDKLEILPMPLLNEHLTAGIQIGINESAGQRLPVCVNEKTRKLGTHIIGKPGYGKTSLMESLILQDIHNNQGLVLIDPHGDSAKRLLELIPPSRINDTIYIDFGDPDWVPLWNPLKINNRQRIGRISGELVTALKSIVNQFGWGDRLETLLQLGFNGLLHLEDASLFDLLILFEQNTPAKRSSDSKLLQKRLTEAVDNEVVKRFFENNFDNYRRDDFAPPHHKLNKLLGSDEIVSLMLTQRESRLNFDDIMNSSKILMFDLSGISPDTGAILGRFIFSLVHSTTLNRNKMAVSERPPFSIYCDEAHNLTSETLENVIVESRKYGVNLTLAHQYLDQFSRNQKGALTSIGNTIIFNVNLTDAACLINDLQGKVQKKEVLFLD